VSVSKAGEFGEKATLLRKHRALAARLSPITGEPKESGERARKVAPIAIGQARQCGDILVSAVVTGF
jgi:hypothetical protein